MRFRNIKLFVRSAIRNGPVDLLPHWLRHYKMFGVEKFALTVHGGCQAGNIDQIRAALREIDVDADLNIRAETWQDDEVEMEIMPSHLRRIGCNGRDCWVMHADLDEFSELPMPANELAERIEHGGYQAFVGNFIDRVTEDGSLIAAKPDTDLRLQYPIGCHISVRLAGCWGQKVMLSRSDIRVGGGHHSAAAESTHWLRGLGHVHHFKWREGVVERLEWALGNTSSRDAQWGKEAMVFMDLIRPTGKLPINDERIGAQFMGDMRPQPIPYTHNFVCPGI